jgi:hypothetical protein
MLHDPKTFQIVALKHGLKLYAKTKMLPNRLWTPKNMMATAEKLTGQKFKAQDYLGAAAALQEILDERV